MDSSASIDMTEADFSIFVGDLAPDVTDYVLQEQFRLYFPSVRSAKVITDPVTLRSKGYGFVRFGSEQERDRALGEMNGVYISSRPIRVSLATAKKSTTGAAAPAPATAMHPSDYDPGNTTLFIGGLSASVTEEQLRSIFMRFGDIIYTKIPQGKGCGFVQYVDRRAAEIAMAEMNGQVIGNSSVRISWGRSSTKATAPVAPSTQPATTTAAAATPYPYAAAPYPGGYYDPSYAAAYGAYGADPYAAYGAYGAAVDPYSAYQGYSMASAGGAFSAAVPPHAVAMAPGPGMSMSSIYDPASPVNVDKMNAIFMHRNLPVMTGSFLRS